MAPLRSSIPAEWTITIRSRPRTSTTMSRCTPRCACPRHSPGSPLLGRLRRLTVDDSSARLSIPAMRYPHIPARSLVSLPRSPTTASSKLIVDRSVRRKVSGSRRHWQPPPQDVDDSIHHLAHVGGSAVHQLLRPEWAAANNPWVSVKSVG